MVLDETCYISANEEILNDHIRCSNFEIPTGKEINYIKNLKKTITSDLELLKNEEIIEKATYKNIKPVGYISNESRKVQKETKNGQPPFSPILSAISSPTYKLVKSLLPFLALLSKNE